MKSHTDKLIHRLKSVKNSRGTRVTLTAKDRFYGEQLDEAFHLLARLSIKIDRLESKLREHDRKMIDREGG